MNRKKIGVWMDYSKAMFIAHEPPDENIKVVLSEHDTMPREDGQGADGTRWGAHGSSNEYKKDHKEIEQLRKYFSALEELLLPYDEILLFGPTNARSELKNRLAENGRFAAKKIHVESADQLTDNQLKAFVREYYTNRHK